MKGLSDSSGVAACVAKLRVRIPPNHIIASLPGLPSVTEELWRCVDKRAAAGAIGHGALGPPAASLQEGRLCRTWAEEREPPRAKAKERAWSMAAAVMSSNRRNRRARRRRRGPTQTFKRLSVSYKTTRAQSRRPCRRRGKEAARKSSRRRRHTRRKQRFNSLPFNFTAAND